FRRRRRFAEDNHMVDHSRRIHPTILSAEPLSGGGASHVLLILRGLHMVGHGGHAEQAAVGRCSARKACRRAPFVFLQYASLPRSALATIRSSPLVVATMVAG